ncbi:MAG: C-type lectin domain-containing protein [Ruminococcus sp.]|nr:C-type lectin domain-containing protein [Ruminococcus sp.]
MKSLLKQLLLTALVIIIVATADFMCVNCFCGRVSVPDDAAYFNGHMYRAFESDVSWVQAERLCRKMGGHLVTITSRSENDFVVKLINANKNITTCHVGTYIKKRRNFTYDYEWVSDGGGFVNAAFSLLRFGVSDFVSVTRTGKWCLSKADGSQSNGYVCEWEFGRVCGIEQSGASASCAEICWQVNRLAKNYVLYSYDAAHGKYVEHQTTKWPHLTIRGLKSGRVYKFALCMTVNSGKAKQRLKCVYFSVVTAPKKAERLSFKDKQFLTWKSVYGADGYDVYKLDSNSGEWRIIGSVRESSFKIGIKIGSAVQQYKVRAFKKSTGGKKFYGDYSNAVKR